MGSISASQTRASATNAVPMLKAATVRPVGVGAQLAPVLQAAARCRRNMTHDARKPREAAPRRYSRHCARNSIPLKTAPPAPSPARASGMAQQDDEMSAPSPNVAPNPATHPVDALSVRGTREAPSSAWVTLTVMGLAPPFDFGH